MSRSKSLIMRILLICLAFSTLAGASPIMPGDNLSVFKLITQRAFYLPASLIIVGLL